MNANIMNTQIYYFTFMFKKSIFIRYLFCLKSDLIKTFYELYHYYDTEFYKINFDLKGHLRSHKVIFVFEN